MKQNKLLSYVSFVVLLLILYSCVSCSKLPEPAPPGSGITNSGSLEDIGITPQEIDWIISNIEKDFPAIRSMLLIKDDSLLYEWNRKGVNPNDVVAVHSGAKIITAILAGIAIDEGLFQSEYTIIKNVCPDEYIEKGNVNETILQTDIHTLLSMESGIRFADMNSSLETIIRRIKTNSNVMYNLIRLPIDNAKAGKFEYSTESYLAINSMIMEVSGITDYEYAILRLFEPLGISPIAYTADFENMGNVSRDLYLRPVDFAKIGMLLLNDGIYDGIEIVSKEWVEKCMTKHTRGNGEEYPNQNELDFTYGMWMDDFKGESIVFSYGKNGQYLILLPQHGILLTILSDEKDHDLFYRDKLLDWLLAAIK